MFGEVQVYWNITPAVVSEFEVISGTVTMKDGQSFATIILKVLNNINSRLHRKIQMFSASNHCIICTCRPKCIVIIPFYFPSKMSLSYPS